MDETFGTGFDANTSVSVPNDNKPQGVAPLVIKQIHDLKENAIQLYGLTIGMCSLVAIVRHIDHSSTKITYHLEDHTGQIAAHYWLEDGANSNSTVSGPPIVVNTYCRIHGSVRSQNSAKTIMLFKIEPITTINEVTTHLLEVLNARYTAEKFSTSEYGSESAGSIANGFVGLAVSNGGGTTATTAPARSSESATGLKGRDLAVFEAIRQYPGDVGISFDDLLRKFSHIQEADLRKITEFMAQEGHIYTSIDADHFLSTEGM